MSEYQYVAFRAVDAPVSGKDLEFMREQSTRAKITPWSFDNEYHFGDFHGKADEMLRRGYDFHLRYADFGIRKLMIRLPHGLSDATAAAPYFKREGIKFSKDRVGSGGLLCVQPYVEAGTLDDPDDLQGLIERLVGLRKEILDGDLRPLYLAHLAVISDCEHDPEEEKEGPVPGGLDRPTKAQLALAEFLGIDRKTVKSAAAKSPPLAKLKESGDQYGKWLAAQPEKIKTAWLSQLMASPQSEVRREILAEFRKSHSAQSWPTVRADRTVAQLIEAEE